MYGKLLADITVFPTVEPHIMVKAPKRRRGWNDGDGDGEGGGGEGEQKKGKGRGRRNRGKGKGKDQEEAREDSVDVQPVQDVAVPKANEEHVDSPMPDATAQGLGKDDVQSATAEVVVFVVHRIASVDRGDDGRFIVFSAVG